LVVDPVVAFIASGTDTHRDAAVRRVLAPLAEMARRQHVAVLAVAHLNKGNAAKLLDRLGGSVAFGAAPRSVLAFARNPDDPDGDQGSQRVIEHAKSNHGTYARTLAAHIEGVEVDRVGSVSRLVIDGETEIGPEDLHPGADGSSGSDVEEAIVEALTDGERASREVKAQVAPACGVTPKTVQRAAMRMRDRGELVVNETGFPARTFWSIATVRTPQSGHRVPTEDVLTVNPQYSRAIPTVDASSEDTHAGVSSLMSFAQAADHLEVDHQVLSWLVSDGVLIAHQEGRQRLFDRAEVDACRNHVEVER
ncbi:MAG: hypothetical protein ACRDL8_10845, partial [Solirubrobacteraceae bacterium]